MSTTKTRSYRISGLLSAVAAGFVIGVVACPSRNDSESGAKALVSVQVSPENPSAPRGTTRQFTATGNYSDGSTVDITALAEWTSSVPAHGAISTTGDSRGLAVALELGDTTITASYRGRTGSTTLTVASAELVTIEVTPTNPQLALGTGGQFAATGTYTDGSTRDLTAEVVWESSAADKSTVSNEAGSQGAATSVGLGDALITASLASVQGATTLTITNAVLASLHVTPTNPTIAAGTSQQFTAVGTFSDGTVQDLTTEVVWTSSAAAGAVSNTEGSEGRADGVAVGSATISAAHSGFTGATTLSISNAELVSIAVTPVVPVIALGTTQSFAATGLFTDGSVQDLTSAVTWTTSDGAIATVADASDAKGLAQSLATGSATVSAALDGITGSTTLTVSSATLVSIAVTPSHPAAALGTTRAFEATGTYTDGSTQSLGDEVTWSTSDAAVATVSNAAGTRGLATTVAVGSATITAALVATNGSTSFTVTEAELVAIAVSPDEASLAQGTALPFTAQGILSDGTRQDLTDQVAWSSSDDWTATISNAGGSRGLATAVSVGHVTITAGFGGVSGTAALEVSPATLVSIEIAPYLTTIAKGTQVQLTALGEYSDGSTQDLTDAVTWSSSAATFAAISNAVGSQGLVTGLSVGSVTITAAFSDVDEQFALEISAALLESIELSPADLSLPAGASVALEATGLYSDAGTQDITGLVTWSSSDPAVATVSNAAGSEGLVLSVASGVATITASHSGKSATSTLTVTSATLISISVAPAEPSVPAGYSSPLQATGSYSDGSSRSVTTEVLWSSSNPAVASVSNSAGTEGRVTGVAVGTATLTATFPDGTATATVTVTNEVLESIEVEPSPLELGVGELQQMTAWGHFSGGSVVDITLAAKWQVTPRSVASVGNWKSQGKVKAKKAGNTTIRARKDGLTGTAALQVGS